MPRPLWYSPPGQSLSHGALGYRKLPGRTPEWGSEPGPAFARDLGVFMARLHALDATEALSAGVKRVDAYERMVGARNVVMPVMADRLSRHVVQRIEGWWEAFSADARMRVDRLSVCHHDLWHDNLLISDDGRLSGVLDLAHVEVTDPAHDFAAPRYFGEPFMRHLLDAYRTAGGSFDAEDEHRASRYSEAREFGGLAWAIEHDDEAEVDAGIEKMLRRLEVGE